MSKIDVALSSLPEEEDGVQYAVFHNLRYTNDGHGGNQNEMTFEITNWSGNMISVAVAGYATDKRTGKTELTWGAEAPYDAVRLTIRGACENAEFLKMLQLILETEKMVEIIKP